MTMLRQEPGSVLNTSQKWYTRILSQGARLTLHRYQIRIS